MKKQKNLDMLLNIIQVVDIESIKTKLSKYEIRRIIANYKKSKITKFQKICICDFVELQGKKALKRYNKDQLLTLLNKEEILKFLENQSWIQNLIFSTSP